MTWGLAAESPLAAAESEKEMPTAAHFHVLRIRACHTSAVVRGRGISGEPSSSVPGMSPVRSRAPDGARTLRVLPSPGRAQASLHNYGPRARCRGPLFPFAHVVDREEVGECR